MEIPDVNQELRNVHPNKLIPYEMNPRKNDEAVQYVADSLAEFGQIRPIGTDENLEIIYGHTTLKAIKKLKLKVAKVCVHKGLTDTQKQAYRIADNKLQERAYWDYGLLEKEMKKIVGKMKTSFIFTEDELEEMFNFDIVDKEDLEPSHAPNNQYVGNALSIHIHTIICFIDSDGCKEYIDELQKRMLDLYNTDQKKYNAFGENILNMIKVNEKTLLPEPNPVEEQVQ